jgi:hypothetical protein
MTYVKILAVFLLVLMSSCAKQNQGIPSVQPTGTFCPDVLSTVLEFVVMDYVVKVIVPSACAQY